MPSRPVRDAVGLTALWVAGLGLLAAIGAYALQWLFWLKDGQRAHWSLSTFAPALTAPKTGWVGVDRILQWLLHVDIALVFFLVASVAFAIVMRVVNLADKDWERWKRSR